MTAPEPIRVTRDVSVPPEAVWPYLSNGQLWTRWQGASCVIEPRPGGRFEMTMPDGAIASGIVIEAVEHRRLRFTWGWQGTPLTPGSTTVDITLDALADGGTRITLTHHDVPDDLVDHHLHGWQRCLTALVAACGRPSTRAHAPAPGRTTRPD